jgi:hypothetical protein
MKKHPEEILSGVFSFDFININNYYSGETIFCRLASLKLNTMETTPALFPGFEDESLQKSFDQVLTPRKRDLIKAQRLLEAAVKTTTEQLLTKATLFELTIDERSFLNYPTTGNLKDSLSGYTLLGEIIRRGIYESLHNNKPSFCPFWIKINENNHLYLLDWMGFRGFVQGLNQSMNKHGFLFSSITKAADGILVISVKYDYTKQHAWLK